jgi:hypothetical protein
MELEPLLKEKFIGPRGNWLFLGEESCLCEGVFVALNNLNIFSQGNNHVPREKQLKSL